MQNINLANYDPHKHPCYKCTERHATCHGHCERERVFNENRPPRPVNTYSESGKPRDIFHKKGRVIRNG